MFSSLRSSGLAEKQILILRPFPIPFLVYTLCHIATELSICSIRSADTRYTIAFNDVKDHSHNEKKVKFPLDKPHESWYYKQVVQRHRGMV